MQFEILIIEIHLEILTQIYIDLIYFALPIN